MNNIGYSDLYCSDLKYIPEEKIPDYPTYYYTNYNFTEQKMDNNIINEDKNQNNEFSNDNREINIDKNKEIILKKNNIKKGKKIDIVIKEPKKGDLNNDKNKKEDIVEPYDSDKINELLKDKTIYKINKDELREEILLKLKFLNKKRKRKTKEQVKKLREKKNEEEEEKKIKKKGRKKNIDKINEEENNNNLTGSHSKISSDNIIKKIKSKLFTYLISYINSILNINNEDDENNKLLKLSYEYIKNLNTKDDLNYLNMELKELLSKNINGRYKLSENANKNKIDELLNIEKDNVLFNHAINLTFKKWLNIFIYQTKDEILDDSIKQFNGLNKLLNEIALKNKEKGFMSNFLLCLYNYYLWFVIKNPRKRNNKK